MSIITKMHFILSNFWHNSKIKWDALDSVLTPKNLGRLGLRNFHLFSQALLARNGWKLLQNSEALWAKVL